MCHGWNVEHTDEFAAWWHELDDGEQEDITATALLLMEHGPQLPFPHSSGIEGSRHGHMRELREQSRGRPIRVFYAFDPRFYEWMIPVADRLYDQHIEELKKEGLIE